LFGLGEGVGAEFKVEKEGVGGSDGDCRLLVGQCFKKRMGLEMLWEVLGLGIVAWVLEKV
jgi:hypothetical protein